jgi:hypothetical protein
MAVETIRQLDELMRSTVPARRAAVAGALAGSPTSAEAVRLRDALAALEAVPAEGERRQLRAEGGRTVLLDLGYEIEELRKDLLFLDAGEASLRRDLSARHEGLDAEVDAVVSALSGTRLHTLVTDRDGTVNNYCGRYASSVQPLWNAVYLTRFARTTTKAVVLTSGPLQGPGILDLSVAPEDAFVYAGSKGREYLESGGRRRVFPIDSDRQARLDDFNRRLDALLHEPGHEMFSLVGSGLQHKFGQTTIARQDIAGSIPVEASSRFLDAVRSLVRAVDPGEDVLRVEDTGLDVEVLLTVDGANGGRLKDFDKGDGVRFLDRDLPLEMGAGPCLVCGDTASDVPMLEAALSLAPEVHAVFVTRREELRSRVRALHPGALFVSTPDALVAALDTLGRGNGRQ